MSDAPSSDVHSLFVTNWENKFKSKHSLAQRVQLFEMAILAIENRARVTLSGVALLVILDRVLQQSKDKYPILYHITIDSNIFKIHDHKKQNESELNALLEALRFFLIELLRVFGRLTAEILTIPLHNELLKVTWTEQEKK